MHAQEQEIRELATRSPFVPFTVVRPSGERYAAKHHAFILFMPTIDETTLEPLPEEERPPYFIVAGKGDRNLLHLIVWWRLGKSAGDWTWALWCVPNFFQALVFICARSLDPAARVGFDWGSWAWIAIFIANFGFLIGDIFNVLGNLKTSTKGETA